MRRISVSILTAVLLATANAPSATESSGGKYKDLLIKVMRANSQGECPGDLMSPVLQDQCEQQMPNMRSHFEQLGDVTGAIYKGVQQSANGPAEVYRVTFTNGNMTWMINTGPDGKIVVLWSPG